VAAGGKRSPDVGYLRQLNAEGILSMRPTLVLASAQAQPSLALKQVEQSHVKVVTVPGSNDLSVIDEKVRVIAEATHQQAEGEILRGKLRQALQHCPRHRSTSGCCLSSTTAA
jgi:iron complex transport system substrate-binding protein